MLTTILRDCAAVVAAWVVAIVLLGRLCIQTPTRRQSRHTPAPPAKPRLTRDDFTLAA